MTSVPKRGQHGSLGTPLSLLGFTAHDLEQAPLFVSTRVGSHMNRGVLEPRPNVAGRLLDIHGGVPIHLDEQLDLRIVEQSRDVPPDGDPGVEGCHLGHGSNHVEHVGSAMGTHGFSVSADWS